MAFACNLRMLFALLFICLALPSTLGQCFWSQGPECGPVASYVVQFNRERYDYPEQAAVLVNNATGARLASNCGVIYFTNDMAGAPADLCQDSNGRIVKHLPMSALQSVITTLQSASYSNYLKWDPYSGIAYYYSVAAQGASVGSLLAA
ncbi:hypothetical protein pqer_cds_613 [Pandoravirus quercus]|uniref:Uncharacterized protein n=2 Tax=Pandoravirus TaxID=2060084 RepID=A0A2U7U9H4_9VIRU|nr:hypothetical protein pqer_cds_613 [Pandoravirus quercus]AVK75035.1 hypothetical protein pqer_cds_613 [Pandoravirus quercus]QBZ81265.1 hypothetical protein pclt_cds_678 [Pandoravirus celtis]